MAEVLWPERLLAVLYQLPPKQQQTIREHEPLLQDFPDMYPVRRRGRFKGCRAFVAGDWTVYYRHVGNKVYIRGLWPARIPDQAV